MFQAVSGERIELNSEDELRERAAPREPIAERKQILEAGRLDRNPCASVRKPLGQLYDLFAAFRFIALAPAGAAAINDLVKRFGPEGPARAADQLRNLDGITDPNPAPVAALETRLHCRNLSRSELGFATCSDEQSGPEKLCRFLRRRAIEPVAHPFE